MSDECDVCNGQGDYPIYNKFASHVMTISCPACFGDGLDDETRDAKRECGDWQRRYELAMAEKRAREASP